MEEFVRQKTHRGNPTGLNTQRLDTAAEHFGATCKLGEVLNFNLPARLSDARCTTFTPQTKETRQKVFVYKLDCWRSLNAKSGIPMFGTKLGSGKMRAVPLHGKVYAWSLEEKRVEIG